MNTIPAEARIEMLKLAVQLCPSRASNKDFDATFAAAVSALHRGYLSLANGGDAEVVATADVGRPGVQRGK